MVAFNHYTTYNLFVRNIKHGFTLIELVAVIVVIIILAAVILARIGDIRSATYRTSANQTSKEFSKTVEFLVANGSTINSQIQNNYAGLQGISHTEVASDPYNMGCRTVTWHISTTTSPNPQLLADLGTMVNAEASRANYASSFVLQNNEHLTKMLQVMNADVVFVYSGSGLTLQSVLLTFK